MVAFYSSLKDAEIWIYIILALIAIFPLRKMLNAIHEYQGSLFGMEKAIAREKLVQSASFFLALALLAGGEFAFVTYAGNHIPAVSLVATPGVNLEPTETPARAGTVPAAEMQPTMLLTESVTDLNVLPTLGDAGGSPGGGCIPGSIEWTDPPWGSEINGIIEFKGSANITNFGFYYFEVSQDNSTWVTHSAGRTPVSNGVLGTWNTTSEVPGDYTIRLIVTNNQGEQMAPCLLQVKVVRKVVP